MHQHSGTKTHPSPLGSVTTNKAFKNGATILADVTACLSPDDLHAALSLYPAELRQVILSHVGLRTMRQVTPSAATGLVRVLQGGDRKRRASLINAISLPCLFGFQNCDDLSTDDCVKLLDRGTQAEVLPQAIMFATALRSVATLPEIVVDLILAHIFLANVPLSPIALALLLGSAERMSPEAAEIVREGWEELRAAHSELPETPVSIHELQEAISSLPAEMIAAKTSSAVSDPETPGGQGETNSMPEEEEDEADVPDSIESIKSDLNRLRQTFAAAVDAADRLREAFADAERPDDQDAELITQSIQAFDRLRARLEAAEGTPISATNCGDLQAALDRLVSADTERRKILALAKVKGPASLEPALQEIREAAAQGSPVLGILADLIQLSNDSSAILQIDALQERFREEAPATWRPVATAAALGRLSVPAELETAATETNESGDDPAGEPISGQEPPDDGEEEHGEPAKREPSSIPPPPGMHADDESTDGVAELDAFLTDHLGELDVSAPSDGETGRPTAQPSAATAGSTASAHPGPSSETTALETTEAHEVQPSVAATAVSSADSGDVSTGKMIEPPTDESPADEDRVAQAEAVVLRAGRFGLAGWLRMAAGRPAAEVSARQCAAIAARMSEFSGRLASAFAESAAKVSMKALADDAAGRLLAWAAALRTGLIHPTPEAAQLLSELTPTLSQYPGLTACGRAFGKVAHDGIYLLPGLSGRMRNASQAENDQAHAASAAAKLLEEGPAHTIKFALATDVWKFLLQDTSNGLGKLLHITARNDVSRLREVKQELDRLRSEDQIERLIDNTARQRSSGRSSARIHSGARTKLIEKIDKALDLVADWISAATEAESLRTDDSGMSWVVKPLNELRGIVAENRARVDGELAQMERSADPVLAAAAVGAAMLIKETLALLDGHIPAGAEPPAAHVLNQDLLLSPSIRVDSNTLSPVEQPTLSDLVALATAGDQGWREAFDRRAERGDHEGTRAILHVLTDRDPQLAAELRQRREKLVHSARHERDNRIEDITDRLAAWRRDGVLPEADATRLSARLNALAGDDREDFGVIAEALRELEREAAKIRQEEIDAESERLAELCATDVNAAARDRISAYIEAGDLTTAREFMAQVKEGKDLPELTEAIDHLDQFFPLFPEAFEEIAQRPGSYRNGEGAELLQRLKDALNSGNEVADPTLRRLLDRAGLSISAIPRSRRGVAGHAVRVWQTLSQGPKAAGNLKTAITAILQMIGLEGRQGDSREERNRLWITLDQVQTFGEPLLPAFGSRMSPSGDRLRLLLVWRPTGPQQVMDCLKDQPENQTVLVFYFGVLSADQRRQLAQASRRRPSPVAAVLDHVAISYLACLPDGNWTSTVRLLAPFTATNPYAPTGDVPEEMFKGRADQLRQVTSRTGACFVYGGRQLGKSALLRQAERNIRKTDADRKVISEVIQNIGRVAPVTALWPMLAGRLSEAEVLPRTAASLTDPQEICRAVKEWLAEDSARQLLILLDEADEFLNKDARDAGFANVVRLRNLMRETNDRVKVVFAGLHQTARFESLPNQPFAHLGAPIAIGPLDPQDAYTLLTEPLAALGFRFPTRLAARVIAEANNAPALIQLFADALLTRLRRVLTAHADLPYEITRDDVEAVWRDNKLARGFRDRFEWTLNLDKRYKVIAYTVAFHALDGAPDVPMTAARLRAECEEWWPQGFKDVSGDGFRGLLEECVNLGVLAAEGGCYRLRTPHILNLLGGAEEVENVLGQAESFELPDSFDAQSYRDDYKGRSERSPLTGAQVTRLLSPRNVLHVIAGSPALQIDRVATALEEAAARHKQAQVWRVGQGLTFEGAQQRAAQSSEHDIITVDLSGSSHMKATAMIRTAARAISMPARNTPAKGTLAVALIAPPEHAARWVTIGRRGEDGDLRDTTAEIIELQRFNKPAVRQWMHEVNLGFQDEAGQAALLRTTGGWPVLISRVVSALTENEADRDHALESCCKYLRDKPEDFVRKTGVLSGKAISAAWRTLVEQTEIADGPETLAELLALAGMEEDGHPLSEPSLQEEGFTSTTDLIEVLRILGVLVPDDEGRLRLEPVVADATRRMGWTG